MRPDDLVGYSYRAENYCEEHILNAMIGDFPVNFYKKKSATVERTLNLLAECDPCEIDREHEHSFDSEDFPKVLFRDGCTEVRDFGDDETCGACGRNLAQAPAIDWRTAAIERSRREA